MTALTFSTRELYEEKPENRSGSSGGSEIDDRLHQQRRRSRINYSPARCALTRISPACFKSTFSKEGGGMQSTNLNLTAAGLRESHVHDVVITKAAPNYRLA